MIAIVELAAEATHPLRRSILRDGTPSDLVEFDGDDLPTTLHLGATADGEVVAISTWLERRHPEHPDLDGYQLRGMATAPAQRGTGISGRLLATGVERCGDRGARIVWARARVPALGFYLRNGFEPDGAQYVDPTTGLAHRDIVRFLA